ncbi:hypothetical protein [Streptomyces sp. BP-8]|uniref:Uncharacterized protein n=1 Tax=Streptomyces sirii TaxID=3127701 RepID=A0ABZ2QMH1_9ACTN
MTEPIQRLIALLLRWLLPSSGRHRTAAPSPSVETGGAPAFAPFTSSSRPVLLLARDEGAPLVRPYVLTPEEWQERRERRLQRGRRRALWLAVHGYDAGPPRIHGVEVTG